jgi:hypothetical protein
VILNLTAQTKDKSIFVGKVVDDTSTFNVKDYSYSNTLEPIRNSKNKIEVRLLSIPSFEYTTYLVLTYNEK